MLASFTDCEIAFSPEYTLGPITWQVQSDQVWAVVGPNGSGKSALIAALMGEGTATGVRKLGYESASVVSLEEQSRLISREAERDDSDLTDVVSQGTPVIELLKECTDDSDRLNQLIDLFALQPLLNRGFRKLSTGETRKLLFVRAIASNPELLVLDEPFEGLDVAMRPKLVELIGEITKSTAVILVLNRVDDIPDYTTHVLRIETQQIAQQFAVDSVEEVRARLRQISRIRATDIQLPPPESEVTTGTNDDGSLVRLRNGRVAYTDNLVFENLDWTIQPNEHWQVKGPNGSGKTCLLSLITGDHPQCYVNDIQLFGLQRGGGETIWQIKEHLGFVSTALHWDYRLSVSVRNVILSGFYDSIGLYSKATERQIELAEEWLQLLGLTEQRNESFASLSYGEQRVVLIARAMVKHPRLLLLDEPCLGLDDVNRQLVLALIERLCDEEACSLVYVSHHEEDSIRHIENVLTLS